MNRKSAGILLSIAALGLLMTVAGRPTTPSAAAGRSLRAASADPATLTAETVQARASARPGTSTLTSALPEPRIGATTAPSAPEIAAALPAIASEEDQELPPGAKVDGATLRRLHGEQPLTSGHPHVKPALEVQERNSGWLMALPSVVGTAVGLNDEGEIALVVYTKTETTDVPKVIDGLPVVTWQTGPIASRHGVAKEFARPEGKPGPSAGRPSSKPAYQTKLRPVPIGVSTSLTGSLTPGYWTAGTLGCRVKHLETGATYALSNYHVYSFDGVFTPGGVVLQPGTLDSQGSITDGSDYLGNAVAAAPITFSTSASNKVDGAIATCGDLLGVATLPDGYGVPSTTTSSAAIGAYVEKYGRTTGYTLGTISQINVIVTVQYDEGLARFVGQFSIIKRTKRSPNFSDNGDSGSLIVASGSNSPVGLLFAGSTNSTIANPINEVLGAFNVRIDDGK